MNSDKSSYFAILGLLTLGFFILSLLGSLALWLVALLFLLAVTLVSSFVWPRPAFVALMVLRTATDFLTDQTIFEINSQAINFTSLTGISVLIFALSIFIHQKAWTKNIPLVWPWLVFLALAFFQMFFSIAPGSSLVELLRWSSFGALFFLGYALFPSGEKTTLLIKTLVASALIPTAVAIIQAFSGLEFFDGERWRVNGTFVHPNMLAFFLLLAITLTLFLFLSLPKKSLEKYLYLFLSLPFITALILTYTRGAWLAFFLIIFLVGLLKFRLFLASGLAIILCAYVFVTPFQARLNSLATFSVADSTVWRLELWKDAWDYSQNNLLFGTGPGTATTVIGQHRAPVLGSTEPHNDYIKLILETGLLGLGAYLALLFSLFYRLWTGYQREKWPRRKLLFFFMFVFSIALYLSSAGDNILKDSSLQWSFWALVGALMYSYNLSPREKDRSDVAV